MKNQSGGIRYWFRFKEVKIAAVILFLNMELVVIPIILKGLMGLEGSVLKITAGSWSTAELLFWYWFSGWTFKQIRENKPAKEDKCTKIRDSALVRRLDRWIYEHIIDYFNPKTGFRKKFLLILKGLGYALGLPAIFVVSVFPFIWTIPFTICRWNNWKVGMLIVFAANFARNLGFAEIWDRIWVFF